MKVDMNTGTGWPFGGPEVTVEDAATKAIFQEYPAKGGENVTLKITVDEARQKKAAYLSRLMAYSEKGKNDYSTIAANKADRGIPCSSVCCCFLCSKFNSVLLFMCYRKGLKYVAVTR